MANPKKRKQAETTEAKKSEAEKTETKQEDMINVPRSAIPHLINQDIRDCLIAIFNGQGEVYKVLEEIRELLKE